MLAPEIGMYMADARDGKSPFMEAIGPTADIYSLGLLYHLLLCGTLPQISEELDPDDAPVLYKAALQGAQYIKLSEKLDARHAEIIRKMIAGQPKARYRSCEQVLHEVNMTYLLRAMQGKRKKPQQGKKQKSEKERNENHV